MSKIFFLLTIVVFIAYVSANAPKCRRDLGEVLQRPGRACEIRCAMRAHMKHQQVCMHTKRWRCGCDIRSHCRSAVTKRCHSMVKG